LQGISDSFEVKLSLKQGDTSDNRRMEISNEQVMLAYADDIVVMGETKEGVIDITSKLINASKRIGLHVNEGINIYMVVSRRPPNIDFIEVDNYKFEKVDNFKYLGVNINNKSDMLIETDKKTNGSLVEIDVISVLSNFLDLSCYPENQRYYIL
jgi:hypothetical protein